MRWGVVETKNFESLSEKEQIWPSQQKEAVPIRSIKNLKLILKWFIDSTLSLESSQTLTQNTSWNKLVLLEGNRLNLGWFACSLAASGERKKKNGQDRNGTIELLFSCCYLISHYFKPPPPPQQQHLKATNERLRDTIFNSFERS